MNFSPLLTALLPVLGSALEPILLSDWQNIYTQLQANVAAMTNPIEKEIATGALTALNAAATVAIQEL